MGISLFPPSSGGGAQNFDFVIDMNDTTNNSIALGQQYAAGAYAVSLASGDTSFDIYFLDANGSAVGYSNEASIVATEGFESAVVLGVGTAEVISFTFSGSVSNASSEGDATGAGAYLTSISPFDLPEQDDTATILGGNFATDVEINFTSGTVSLPAKNIVRNNSTQLVATRPDGLTASLNPWSVQALNPGVSAPTGSNANILAGTVLGGSGITWETTSPLPAAFLDTAYSGTVVATDPDGAVTYAITAGTFPGLTLNSTTGVLSGTATALGTATITATDLGGNTANREFALPFVSTTGGSVEVVGNYAVHTFDASGDFVTTAPLTGVEYIILAGGGGSGPSGFVRGGGGGGGLLSSITGFNSGGSATALSSVPFSVGTVAVAIGAGGAMGVNGSDSSIPAVGTALGGGTGGVPGATGGSGGGGSLGGNGGAGTVGQGFGGGAGGNNNSGSGGGTGGAGRGIINNNTGGPGGLGTHNFLDQRGWGAGGGGGIYNSGVGGVGGGSTGNDQTSYAGSGESVGSGGGGNSGVANFGGGAGGAPSTSGGSGKVVIRYEVV